MVRDIAAHEGTPDAVAGTLDTWTGMLARPDVVVLLAERDGEPAGYLRRPPAAPVAGPGADLRTKVVAFWRP